MKAQWFIERFRLPASAWAARPLASGAPPSVIERRCYSSVEVGCPSFGGQRTGSGCSSRTLAGLVTGSDSRLTATRVGIIGSTCSNQTAMSAATANRGSTLDAGRSVADLCSAKLVASGRLTESKSAEAGLNETAGIHIQEKSRHGLVPSSVVLRSRSAHPSRKGWSASSGATLPPNPSVKGTSTSGLRPLAAAPYVER
jgi:hypothetical protein